MGSIDDWVMRPFIQVRLLSLTVHCYFCSRILSHRETVNILAQSQRHSIVCFLSRPSLFYVVVCKGFGVRLCAVQYAILVGQDLEGPPWSRYRRRKACGCGQEVDCRRFFFTIDSAVGETQAVDKPTLHTQSETYVINLTTSDDLQS